MWHLAMGFHTKEISMCSLDQVPSALKCTSGQHPLFGRIQSVGVTPARFHNERVCTRDAQANICKIFKPYGGQLSFRAAPVCVILLPLVVLCRCRSVKCAVSNVLRLQLTSTKAEASCNHATIHSNCMLQVVFVVFAAVSLHR